MPIFVEGRNILDAGGVAGGHMYLVYVPEGGEDDYESWRVISSYPDQDSSTGPWGLLEITSQGGVFSFKGGEIPRAVCAPGRGVDLGGSACRISVLGPSPAPGGALSPPSGAMPRTARPRTGLRTGFLTRCQKKSADESILLIAAPPLDSARASAAPDILQDGVECGQHDQDQHRGGEQAEHHGDDQRFERLGLGRGFQQQRCHAHDGGRD